MKSILIILACAFATAIPKILPMKFMEKKRISMQLAEFLNIIPYTSLAILITRSIMMAKGKMLLPTILASLVAFVAAWVKESIGFTIACGVLMAFFVLYIL